MLRGRRGRWSSSFRSLWHPSRPVWKRELKKRKKNDEGSETELDDGRPFTDDGQMDAVLPSGRLFEIDSALVDAFVFPEDGLEDEADFVVVGLEVSSSVEHLVVGPVLGVLHVLASSIHTAKNEENIKKSSFCCCLDDPLPSDQY